MPRENYIAITFSKEDYKFFNAVRKTMLEQNGKSNKDKLLSMPEVIRTAMVFYSQRQKLENMKNE